MRLRNILEVKDAKPGILSWMRKYLKKASTRGMIKLSPSHLLHFRFWKGATLNDFRSEIQLQVKTVQISIRNVWKSWTLNKQSVQDWVLCSCVLG